MSRSHTGSRASASSGPGTWSISTYRRQRMASLPTPAQPSASWRSNLVLIAFARMANARWRLGSGKLAATGRWQASAERWANSRGYTLIRNLASHGVGRSLHEYPSEIATWPTRGDKRRINKGLVLTVEPFLSSGGLWATERDDEWTLYSEPAAPVVQYEHTVVATDRGAVIVTLPG